MPHALKVPPPGFDELSPEEKLDYVHALWARVLHGTHGVPAPSWHREELAKRLAAHRAGDGDARPWPEVRAEIHEQLHKLKR